MEYFMFYIELNSNLLIEVIFLSFFLYFFVLSTSIGYQRVSRYIFNGYHIIYIYIYKCITYFRLGKV